MPAPVVARPVWVSLLLLATLLPAPGRADDAAAAEEQAEPAAPLVMFTFGSLDKAMSDIAWMFESAGRPDMMDVIGGFLSTAGDLKGIDRTKPFGQVIFLETAALPPRPAFIGFVPISNLDDALKTLALSPLRPQPVAGRTDMFEAYAPEGDDPAVMIRIVGDYAFMAPGEFADTLDSMPDMPRLIEPMGERYDVSLTLQIKSVPEGVRRVFMNFLRTQAEIDLQRRDDEPEAQYLVRRANGISSLEFFEQIVLEGEDLTFGWNTEPEKKSGYLEITMNASPDSSFAEYLTEVAGKPSMFTALRQQEAPLTVNVSWAMNQREKTAATDMLKAAKILLSERLTTIAQPGGPIERMFDSLQATVDLGHFDMFFQFTAADVQEFVLVGGLRLAGAQSFGTALEQTLQHAIVYIEEQGATEKAPGILINADSYQGANFHKITPREVRSDDERLYGGKPDFYVGTSSRVLWFAIGGNDALTTLHTSMDTLLNAPPAEQGSGDRVPVSVTARVAPWLELPERQFDDNDEELQGFEAFEAEPVPVPTGNAEADQAAAAELQANRAERRARFRQMRREQAAELRAMAQEAFGPTDALRIDVRPTDSGLRTRITLDEGFVKMLGMAIARGYDEMQL